MVSRSTLSWVESSHSKRLEDHYILPRFSFLKAPSLASVNSLNFLHNVALAPTETLLCWFPYSAPKINEGQKICAAFAFSFRQNAPSFALERVIANPKQTCKALMTGPYFDQIWYRSSASTCAILGRFVPKLDLEIFDLKCFNSSRTN